jgi:hypothetical protein
MCCAGCGRSSDVRLFDIRIGNDLDRRWWCLECRFSARRRGVIAEPAPAWIERAAERRLPLKLLPAARSLPR